MKTHKALLSHLQKCTGFDNQGDWMSVSPLKPLNFGFVYCIHNNKLDKCYLGSKQYRFYTEDGFKPSQWQSYYGSSKDLLADIDNMGVDCFDRYVLTEHNTKNSLLYAECNLQHRLNVLYAKKEDGSYLYYNKYIDRCFRGDG